MVNLPRNGQVSNERSFCMSRSLQAAIYAGLLMLLVVFAGSAGAATGESETAQTTVVLGETATMPDPSCPESPCQAIGSVTGFHVSPGQGSVHFSVGQDGKITSW